MEFFYMKCYFSLCWYYWIWLAYTIPPHLQGWCFCSRRRWIITLTTMDKTRYFWAVQIVFACFALTLINSNGALATKGKLPGQSFSWKWHQLKVLILKVISVSLRSMGTRLHWFHWTIYHLSQTMAACLKNGILYTECSFILNLWMIQLYIARILHSIMALYTWEWMKGCVCWRFLDWRGSWD